MAHALLLLHVLISLVGIATGLVVIVGLLISRSWPALTAVFLTTTILTSVTGFFLPAAHFMPSHAVGILSLLLLAAAVYARYSRRMAGTWRWIFIVTAMASEFLNVFVGIAQSFQKIPPLHQLAPTGSEPPFAAAVIVTLLLFIAVGIAAIVRFKLEPAGAVAT